ncbi:hypothetical protein KAR91_17830 [Candidatus Pacearchaeota archaeon]|nr:hypothetical protein [Candidatus Pacearchaeota archaeon]
MAHHELDKKPCSKCDGIMVRSNGGPIVTWRCTKCGFWKNDCPKGFRNDEFTKGA